MKSIGFGLLLTALILPAAFAQDYVPGELFCLKRLGGPDAAGC